MSGSAHRATTPPAAAAPPSTASRSASDQCDAAPASFSRVPSSDSGTTSRMNSVSRAATAQPAEDDAAGRRPDQEAGEHDPVPQVELVLRRRAAEQLAERVLADEREEAHLHAVEHPPEQGGNEGQESAAGRSSGGGHGAVP